MKLQLFNGGLNVRHAPELIAPNESVVCNNVSLNSGQIKSTNGLAVSSISALVEAFYFKSNSEWLGLANSRSYVEYQEKLYWTDGISPKKYDGTNTYNLGIVAPTAAPIAVLNGAGTLDGTLQYVYTYYNVSDGTESVPSPISAELVATANSLDVSVIASTDPQVTHIFIYRIGNTFTKFTKVAELPNVTAAHTDDAADSTLAVVINDSGLNEAPQPNLTLLTYAGSTFFAAIASRLYFTSNPNYWPAANYLDFRHPITGISDSPNGTLIFSGFQTWILTGTSIATFVKQLLSTDQGCINPNTIATMGRSVLFVSTDGICAATGGTVTVLSKQKLGTQLYDTINAVVHDEEYFLQLADNTILAVDLRYEPAIETYDFQTLWLTVANDVLYAATATGLRAAGQGSPVTYAYTTGDYTDGSLTELKNYKSIYVYAEGQHTLEIYINGVSRLVKEIIGGPKPTEIKIPQEYQAGSSIRFSLTGLGTIKEIEYKAMSRSNGK